MGWLRLLLATCVVAFHTGGLDRPFFMLSGTHAVEAFFLISGYFMAAVLDTKYRGQRLRWALIAGMTVFTVMFPSRLDGLPQIDPNRVVYMACLFLVLPMLSRPTATSRIDRICGDLSYPVYIVHLPLLAVLASLGLEPPYGGFAPFAVLMVPTLVLSAMLLYAVDRPIDRFREATPRRPYYLRLGCRWVIKTRRGRAGANRPRPRCAIFD